MKVRALRVGSKSLLFGWNPTLSTFILKIQEDGQPEIFLGTRQGELPTYAAFEKQLLSQVPLTEQLRSELEPLKTESA